MAGLTKSIPTIFLLLSFVGLHVDAHLASMSIESILRGVVVGHYQGITQNSFKEATRFYHSDSPDLVRIQTELSQAEYFKKTTMLSFSVIDKYEELAIGTARHRFLRISGMKFSEEFAGAEYVFRKESGTWKLWTTQMTRRADAMPFHNPKETKR